VHVCKIGFLVGCGTRQVDTSTSGKWERLIDSTWAVNPYSIQQDLPDAEAKRGAGCRKWTWCRQWSFDCSGLHKVGGLLQSCLCMVREEEDAVVGDT